MRSTPARSIRSALRVGGGPWLAGVARPELSFLLPTQRARDAYSLSGFGVARPSLPTHPPPHSLINPPAARQWTRTRAVGSEVRRRDHSAKHPCRIHRFVCFINRFRIRPPRVSVRRHTTAARVRRAIRDGAGARRLAADTPTSRCSGGSNVMPPLQWSPD